VQNQIQAKSGYAAVQAASISFQARLKSDPDTGKIPELSLPGLVGCGKFYYRLPDRAASFPSRCSRRSTLHLAASTTPADLHCFGNGVARRSAETRGQYADGANVKVLRIQVRGYI
jgi:hypothetical protein